MKRRQISVYLTDDELLQLRQTSKRLGLSLSGFLVRAALRKPLPRPIPALNRAAYTQLCRLGANLNQIVRAMHLRLPTDDPTSLLHTLTGLLLEIRNRLINK